MRLNASKQPAAEVVETTVFNQRPRRVSRPSAWGVAALGLLVTGSMLNGTILPSAAQAPTAPAPAAGGKLTPYTETLPQSTVKVDMVPIPGGTVTIRNKPYTVKPFYIAKTETPWEAYDVFLLSGTPSPSYGQIDIGPDAIALPSKSYILPDLGWGHNGFPAINVSFLSVDMYCRWLSKATGKKYRIPTEAEWEIACRGGANGPWKPLDKATLEKSAWYIGNSSKMSHPVGKKAPNKFGLYDMFGNPGEWATDAEGQPLLCGGTFLDGPTAISPITRRRQTPKWQETDPQFPKSRWWLADGKFVGFRVVCEP